MTIYTRRGSFAHDRLGDAFLDWGGYLLVGGKLAEVLGAVHVPTADKFRWAVRWCSHVGRA